MAHGRPVRLAAHDHADHGFARGAPFDGRFCHALSGDNVGNELAFQLDNLVLQPELALLQALQLELVERSLLDQTVDHVIEVAMLALQRLQLGLYRLGVQRF